LTENDQWPPLGAREHGSSTRSLARLLTGHDAVTTASRGRGLVASNTLLAVEGHGKLRWHFQLGDQWIVRATKGCVVDLVIERRARR
jgi:hypothetical protein